MRLSSFVASVMVIVALAGSTAAAEGDWPGWRGPRRDCVSKETGLLKEWPEKGPKMLWQAKGLGAGFSTPSVAGGRIYLLGTKDKEQARDKTEYLIALNARDGTLVWDTAIGKTAGGHAGPRSTPTIDGDLVYALASNGQLACVETATGKVRWTKDFRKEFGGQSGGWAYAESPLIDGDLLICTPGGAKATFAALDKRSGTVRWTAAVEVPEEPAGQEPEKKETKDKKKDKQKKKNNRKRNYAVAGYSSVIIAELQGTKQYVQFLNGGVVGVDARDGKLLWHYDNPANGTANISTPVQHGDAIFAASAYGTGGGLARIVKSGEGFRAEQVYFVSTMQNHHGGMIRLGDHLYGTNNSSLICLDLKTGKPAWQERGVGKGSLFYADGHLYHRSEAGPIALVEATPAGYREKGRFDQPQRSSFRAWPHPVVAGGRLLLRDWDNLFCYDVKGP